MLLGIALAVLVLGRGRRSDVASTTVPFRSIRRSQVYVDDNQLVRFQQAAELEQDGGIGARLAVWTG